MKILFDITNLLHADLREHNYILNGLIPAMLHLQEKHGANIEFLHFSFPKNNPLLPDFIKKNKLHSFRFPQKILQKLWLNVNFPDLKFFFGEFDIVHSPSFSLPVYSNARKILNVQDLRFLRSPGSFGSNDKSSIFNYNDLLSKNIYKANHLIASSEFTKNELIDQFNIPSEKISIVYNSADNPQRSDIHDVLIYLRLQGVRSKKFIYLPNASYFSKQTLERMINAFLKSDADKNIKLLIAFDKKKHIFDTLENPRVLYLFLNRKNEENILFNNSLFVLYTPLYDGSGLTLIKAFAFSKAVITSNNSALDEIALDSALKVNPESQDDMTNAMNSMFDADTRKDFELKAKERSSFFSWNKMASSFFQIYNPKKSFDLKSFIK